MKVSRRDWEVTFGRLLAISDSGSFAEKISSKKDPLLHPQEYFSMKDKRLLNTLSSTEIDDISKSYRYVLCIDIHDGKEWPPSAGGGGDDII